MFLWQLCAGLVLNFLVVSELALASSCNIQLSSNRRPIAAGVLLSIVLHSPLVLMPWLVAQEPVSKTDLELPITELNEVVIGVDIVSKETPAPVPSPQEQKELQTAEAKAAPVETPVENLNQQELEGPIVSQAQPVQPVEEQVPMPDEPIEPAPEQVQALVDKVATNLQEGLKKYFYYPPVAKQNGYMGRVVLGFRIGRDGKILNIRVVESYGEQIIFDSHGQPTGEVKTRKGGFSVLNAAALDSFKKATRDVVIAEAERVPQELFIPIDYIQK